MAKRSFLGRLFGGIGLGIDFLRLWLGRLIFLLVFGVILYVLFSGPSPLRVPETAALVLAPTGAIVEERDTPALGPALVNASTRPNTLLRDLLQAIDQAAGDERIAALVLKLDEMTAIDPAQLESLQDALQAFRDSGKPVYAYGEYYSQGQYALAAYADNITMHPMGNLILEGYGGNQLFFSELLDRLNINVHVFRVGDYKSASEPFTRMDMSEEARSDSQNLVDELWQRYVERVAAARHIDTSTLLDFANNLPDRVAEAEGDMARAALDQGLVDELSGLDEFRQRMTARVGGQNGTFNQIHHQDYLLATRLPPAGSATQQIAVLVAEGTIVGGQYAPGMVAEEDMVNRIRQARSDDSIRAVVLRVNSPGGAMLASERIRRELATLQQEGKPLVVSMGGTAASGGYWISATADEIWAAPTTVTGSIGVISLVPTFEDALGELGVNTDGVGTTPLSRGADPFSGLSPQMQRLLEQSTEHAYRQFVALVADGRGMSTSEVDAVGRGRVMSGARALEAGLVDNLGTLADAVDAAAGLADISEWQTVYLQRPRTVVEQLLQQLMAASDSSPAMGALSPAYTLLFGQASGQLRQWAEWLAVGARSSGRPEPQLLCESCVSFRPL